MKTQRKSLRPKVSKKQKALKDRSSLLHTLLCNIQTTKEGSPARQLLENPSTPHAMTTTKREFAPAGNIIANHTY
jgi:hypothetical protein